MSNEQMDIQAISPVNRNADARREASERRAESAQRREQELRAENAARCYRDSGIFCGMLAGVAFLGLLVCLYGFRPIGAVLCAVAFGGLLWAARWYWGKVW